MIIQSKNVWFEEKYQPLQIEIQNRKIVAVNNYNCKQPDVDYGDNYILPGLVDIHTHGWNKCDVAHANQEWVRNWRKYLVNEGLTSICATSGTNEYQDILAGMEAVAKDVEENNDGVNIIGVYSEGPFVGSKGGSQPLQWVKKPSIEIVDDFIKATHGLLNYVMLAPETMENNYEVIDYCAKKNIAVAIGHSGASFDTCEEAIKHGIKSFTHTFNGMTPFTNRNQGPVASAMYHKDLFAELIGDGIHVDKITAKIFSDIKGKDKLVSVSDGNRTKGLEVGEYEIFGRKIKVCEDGVARMSETNGIAGGCHKYCEILANEIFNMNFDLVTAINSCTINPCRLLNVKNKGLILEGYDADISVFNEKYEPLAVYVMGEQKL